MLTSNQKNYPQWSPHQYIGRQDRKHQKYPNTKYMDGGQWGQNLLNNTELRRKYCPNKKYIKIKPITEKVPLIIRK